MGALCAGNIGVEVAFGEMEDVSPPPRRAVSFGRPK